MNFTPGISIVIPAFNRKSLLAEAVGSIISQGFMSWEIIIVDDGSADGTDQYVENLADPRIIYISRPAEAVVKGAQVCRNIGIRNARGKYVIFLDSDDILLPGCLEKRYAVMESRPDIDFAVFWAVKFNKDPGEPGLSVWGSQTVTGDELDDFLQHIILWQTAGPIWRRESIIAKQGFWDEDLISVGHDHEYHVRALCMGLKHINTGIVDFGWRICGDSSLSAFDAFKKGYKDGGFIAVFEKIVALLKKYGLLNSRHRQIIKKEAVRLAIQVKINNGKLELVNKIIFIAQEAGVFNAEETYELHLACRLWFRSLGKIPAMSYLRRRFKL